MIKEDYYYTESHEWVKIEGETATFGITDFAQHELGDIVYVELPEIGDEASAGEPFGTVEAVKAVEDLNSPISGEVISINEKLDDKPDLINKSAFEDGWIIKVKYSDKSELDKLLKADDYKKLIEE